MENSIQKFKCVVQGPDELGSNFASRLEEEIIEIRKKKNLGHPGIVMPFISASSSGRQTCMLCWFEEEPEKRDEKDYTTERWIELFHNRENNLTLKEWFVENELEIVRIKI